MKYTAAIESKSSEIILPVVTLTKNLGKLIKSSVPQFPHLYNRKTKYQFPGVGVIIEIIHKKTTNDPKPQKSLNKY